MAVTPDIIQNWLLRIAQQRDSRAFRQFFDYFYQDAYRLAFFYVQDRELAEELVSDVFLKIWHRGESLGTVLHPRTYLLTAVKNYCINHLRQQHSETVSLDDELQGSVDSNAPGPDERLVWDEMQQALNMAVARLPARCQLIFKMVREQQLSYREVAESLGITSKTVEIQMGIALRRLSQLAQTLGENNPTALLALLFSYFF